jgi:predicted transcriptional regulator
MREDLAAGSLFATMYAEEPTMVSMSPEALSYISDAVRLGIYPTPEAALEEAVGLLKKRDELRTEIQKGIDQANRGELLPAQEVFRRLELRVAEIEAQAAQQQ